MRVVQKRERTLHSALIINCIYGGTAGHPHAASRGKGTAAVNSRASALARCFARFRTQRSDYSHQPRGVQCGRTTTPRCCGDRPICYRGVSATTDVAEVHREVRESRQHVEHTYPRNPIGCGCIAGGAKRDLRKCLNSFGTTKCLLSTLKQ